MGQKYNWLGWIWFAIGAAFVLIGPWLVYRVLRHFPHGLSKSKWIAVLAIIFLIGLACDCICTGILILRLVPSLSNTLVIVVLTSGVISLFAFVFAILLYLADVARLGQR